MAYIRLITEKLLLYYKIKRLYCNSSKMKLIFLALTITIASAFPQKEGGIYTNEAIRQAQSTLLIPKDAQIQKVQEGIEVGSYENIPGDQKVKLFDILGDLFPIEVVNNLQQKVDLIGQPGQV